MKGSLRWVKPSDGPGFRYAKIQGRLLGDVVYKSKYFGTFTCHDHAESKIFEIQVEPIGKDEQSLAPPATTLLVNVYLVDNKTFYSKWLEIRNFRSNLKVGDKISLPEKEAPNYVRPDFLKNSHVRYKWMLCGTITEIKDELIQVQTNYGTFFINQERVFPPREQYKPTKAVSLTGTCY